MKLNPVTKTATFVLPPDYGPVGGWPLYTVPVAVTGLSRGFPETLYVL